MNKEKKKFSGSFQKYIHALPQLVLSNLMFAIPVALSVLLIWVVERFTNPVVFIRFLPIFILMPFYSGLCKVTKDVIIGKSVKGIHDFFKAVRDNLKYSIIHGVIFYIVAMADYFAVIFYYQVAIRSAVMYIFFGLCVAVAILSLFCFFYVPIITVTLDIKFKYIYKNAALMSVGELPRNLLALLACVCCVAIVTTLFAFTGSFVGAIIFLAIIICLILPVTFAYFINAILYPSVDKLLIAKSGNNLKETEKNDDAAMRMEKLKQQFEEKPIDPEILKGDENELVFYDGKMIKRSKLIEIYNSMDE